MTEKRNEMHLPSIDELFTTQEQRDEKQLDKVINIPIKEILDFPEHPFKVKNDEQMQRLADSIKEKGILLPTIVRQKQDGSYEMISGHRRKRAAQIVGLKEIPCIVKDLTDDEATILMVDSNIQREEVLPSERAFAYKMKLEALKHQGKRTDLEENLTSDQVGPKLDGYEKISNDNGDSKSQIKRYIRLTYLIPELLDYVDNKRIAFNPAVELSYLNDENQYVVLNKLEYDDVSPSLSQAITLKKMQQEGTITEEKIENLLDKEKTNQKENTGVKYNSIRHYFPKGYDNSKIELELKKILEKYYHKWHDRANEIR